MSIYYKSARFIDGKVILVIEDEDGNINKNPTKEQLKIAIYNNSRGNKSKYKNRMCCICKKKNTYIMPDGIPRWNSCKCGNKGCTGYICSICHDRDYGKNNPNSHNNIIKSSANARTGQLDRNSNTGKSIIDQAVTAKILGTEDLNIKMNNLGYYIDIEHEKHGNIDVKSSSLVTIRKRTVKALVKYYAWRFHTYRKIDVDTFICIGYDRYRKCIERVWIIPREMVYSDSIYIPRDSISRYDKFSIDPILYNDTYHNLMEYLKYKKYFGIEDINEWFNLK